MDAFMSVLIKMSLRGVVIILIVLLVRLLLKRLQISHKYILGLWAMVFLYFIFPWKLSLSVGFWNNVQMSEEVRIVTEHWPVAEERYGEAGDTVNVVYPVGITDMIDNTDHTGIADNTDHTDNIDYADHTIPVVPAATEKDTVGIVTAIPTEPTGQNTVENNEMEENDPEQISIESLIGFIWLAGLSILFGHMLYSYFALKRKLRLSVVFEDNIWLAENIDMPMVFGLIRPQIYLPLSMEFESLTYIIAHEKMHVKRKDSLIKMFVYVVCLVHWFNPFIWIAYFLFGSDLEKSCDEEVIRTMSKEKRKEYAYALLHIASGNGFRKRRVFAAPICFDEGNVKSRIRNIMQYKYTVPGIGAVVVIVTLVLFVIFLTEAKDGSTEDNVKTEGSGEETAKVSAGGNNTENKENAADAENAGADAAAGETAEALPVFYVEDLNALQIGEGFSPEDYYITSRYTFSNHYYIDENGVLWGTGKNEFGQLGTGTYGMEEYHEEPVKIAENVISVDASWNDYFCIYLTENGELYGVGENYVGILLGKGSESATYSHDNYQRVTEPVLLMTDVAYARAGRECIVALKTDHTAYWWGQYAPLTHTHASASVQGDIKAYEDYWTVEEDASNSQKMFAIEPMKIMDQCRYITTGTFSGAAISESGELYTWGFNVFGQCGTPVTGDDFVRTPTHVMDDVKMVWPERIYFSEPLSRSSEYVRWDTDYDFITFAMKTDGTLLAAGLNLGDKEKVTEINGDLVETQTNLYSDEFVPIQVIEYSANYNLAVLGRLQFGMSIDEAEEILNNAGLRTFRFDESLFSAQSGQYHCYFDSQKKLDRITLQEGGSRDGRFTLGMPFSDLEKAVEDAGGTLTQIDIDDTWDLWFYQDQEQQIQYEFRVYEGSVSVIDELVIRNFQSVEPTAVDPDELAEIFGISILLPENSNWITNSEYHLLSKNNVKITYHESIIDSDFTVLVAKNEDLTLPEIEYDERLNESWEGRTINGQNILVKVQRGKNDSKAVLATWEYNEYRFAIIGEIEKEGDSGHIAKVALSIIYDLN